jgi:peptidoglycan/xylan/chitin deacetylase (PgdA/CDA1 family)
MPIIDKSALKITQDTIAALVGYDKAKTMRHLQKKLIVISNFESGEHTLAAVTGGLTANTTSFTSGLRSITVSAAHPIVSDITVTPASAWDLSTAHGIAIDLNTTNIITDIAGLEIKLFTDAVYTKGFSSGNISGRIRVDNTFHSIALRKAEFTAFGGAVAGEWAAVTRAEVITSPASGKTITLALDNLRGVVSPSTRGKVIIRFDDGYRSAITEGATYMSRKGFNGFVNLITNRMDEQGTYNGMPVLSIAQATALQNQGWDVGSHTKSHLSLPDIDNFQNLIEDEIGGSQKWLKQNGFINGSRFFVWPGHQVSRPNLLKVAQTYILGYCGANGIDTYPPQSLYTMHSLVCEGKTAAQIKAEIDKVVASPGLLTLTFHDITSGAVNPSFQVSQTIFREVIDYLATVAVDVITLTDLVDGGLLATS